MNKFMMALTAVNKNSGNGVLQAQVSKLKLQNVAVLSPDLTTFQQNELSLARNK